MLKTNRKSARRANTTTKEMSGGKEGTCGKIVSLAIYFLLSLLNVGRIQIIWGLRDIDTLSFHPQGKKLKKSINPAYATASKCFLITFIFAFAFVCWWSL
jgi:hypothetical protein